MNDTRFDYLNAFYNSPSATFFSIYLWIVCTFVILSDTFFIIMTLTTPSLRKVPANFFLIGFCLADLMHCTAHLVDGAAIWTGSINNRGLCETAGAFVLMTAIGRLGFPPMIAANRFYKISAMPGQVTKKCSIGRNLFAERLTIPLIIGWFCFAYLILSPFIFTHSFGEDEAGFCSAKKFTSVLLLVSYEMTAILVFVVTIALTGVYYYRLAKWLKQNTSISNTDSIVYTRSLMRVMKIETLLPLLTESPTAILTAGQMLLPELPMWLTRILIAPYWFSSCANPWLTIAMLGPFRRRFLQLLSMAKMRTFHEIELHVSSRRITTVQELR